MFKFVAGMFIGFGLSWITVVITINWYLLRRDEVITELMDENKILKRKADKWQRYFDEKNSGY